MKALFKMFDKAAMVTPEAAAPGRPTPMPVPNPHFVLKRPLQGPYPPGLQRAVFGTGCFWGTEKGFWRMPGVYSTAVGYCAGYTPNPTYEEVCSGQTGHNETVQVVYDPAAVSFADLLRQFWQSHDPTQGMGQGGDIGTQYRSGVYCTTEAQKELAEASRSAYQTALAAAGRKRITTEVLDCPEFYYAEDYHQQYLAKPGNRQYCSAQPTGVPLPPFDDWAPPHLRDHKPKLDDAYWAKHGPKPHCTIAGPNAQIVWP